MAVEKMERVSFALIRDKLEEEQLHLISSEAFEPIEIKNALKEKFVDTLTIRRSNPYDNVYSEMMRFLKMADYTPTFDESELDMYHPLDIKETEEKFHALNQSVNSLFSRRNELKKALQNYEKVLFHVKILSSLKIDLGDIKSFERINLIFGRIPQSRYETLVESSRKVPVLVLEVKKETDFSWIFVFTPPNFLNEAYKILHSAYFEEDSIPEGYSGTPKEIQRKMEALIELTKLSIQENEVEIRKILYENKEFVDSVYPTILAHKRIFDLTSYGAFSSENSVYFINGWMPSEKSHKMEQESEKDIIVLRKQIDISSEEEATKVPVKLKNKGKFFKSFELITQMFGTPRYGELDPTPLVALFFTFMYGFMLGDVGHGAILLLFALLMKKKSKKFGIVMASASLSSMFFGFMYGSVFGFDWIPTIWLRPMLKINQLMIISVYFGIGMISVGMAMNVVNGFVQHNWEKAIFGPEGIVGITFYLLSVFSTSIYIVTGKLPINAGVLEVVLSSALVVVFFAHPLNALLKKKRPIFPEGFWVVSGFGMFNVLIEYLSNTISYVRLAAFALTHEALFTAFWILTLMVLPTPGGGIWATIIFLLGQLILVGLEGLVVFIQDLRLTYYEYFTKFFEGSGREFRPFTFRI